MEGTAEWVQCHCPASLDQAIELAEEHMAAVPTAGQCVSPSPLSSLSPSVPCPCPIPPPRRQGPAPPQPARCTHGVLSFPTSLSVSSPLQVSDLRNTGAGREPGPVCWHCGKPGHLQHQCCAMEVGAVVRIPNAPGTALDQARAYRIPTDASYRGLWAVLSQEVEGEDCPVLYISQKPSVRKGRYSTFEKERLAIKWVVLALLYYLLV
ncbi:uncharacterized protein LOC132869552 [Neoarius graeffei]|uniref:uncharacterized protein LOC132869552 n=1 Tax=Neoarius graeffei TaxID=443677 RepID=UPI00298C02C3|nr:uncharacterized protein LOC132869552 [Neoarius graeffei]